MYLLIHVCYMPLCPPDHYVPRYPFTIMSSPALPLCTPVTIVSFLPIPFCPLATIGSCLPVPLCPPATKMSSAPYHCVLQATYVDISIQVFLQQICKLSFMSRYLRNPIRLQIKNSPQPVALLVPCCMIYIHLVKFHLRFQSFMYQICL